MKWLNQDLTGWFTLRPADLREYKIAIEHRDDIKYPFYDAFEGYKKQKQLISKSYR